MKLQFIGFNGDIAAPGACPVCGEVDNVGLKDGAVDWCGECGYEAHPPARCKMGRSTCAGCSKKFCKQRGVYPKERK